MRHILLYTAIAAMSCGMASCVDDDNNYNYGQVNEIQGGANNFGDIEDTYNIPVGQDLTITPTFTFTIDSLNPDMSYEWTMDGTPIEGASDQSHTFNFAESGTHSVSFYVTDNKSGLKYGCTTSIKVMAEYQRGWVILSKGDDGKAQLHFITPTSTKYTTQYNGSSLNRDSIVYKAVSMDVNKQLGQNPTGLTLNTGDADYYESFGIDEYDEVIVRGDQWEELNGNTLAHEVYTSEEFGGDLPEGFKPVEGAFTYSMKALRSADGYIYCNVKVNSADFHAGQYTSVPINNSMKFKRLFPNYKAGGSYFNTILALTEDNSLVGIADAGTTNSYSSDASISENSRRLSGNVYEVTDEDDPDVSFSQMADNIIDLQPAVCSPANDYDYTYSKPSYVALTQNPDSKEYTLKYFDLTASYRGDPYVLAENYQEKSVGALGDYRDMAVFANKRYVMIADGNKLYYCQYGKDPNTYSQLLGEKILVKTFDHDIVALDANDVQVNLYRNKYDYPGQLGVALSNGEFYIFSVVETEDADTGDSLSVALSQVFPNEYVETNTFGRIVDILYKKGRGTNHFMYEF